MRIVALFCLLHLCMWAEVLSQDIHSTVLYNYRSRTKLNHIAAQEQGNMIIVGENCLLRSVDKGKTWTQIAGFSEYSFCNVLFLDANTCVLVGYSILNSEFTAFYSSDAGATWNKALTEGAISSYSASGFTTMETVRTPKGNICVCTTAGDIITSEDKGRTWKRIADVDNELYSLFNTLVCHTDSIVYSFRDTTWYKSSDAGLHWKKMPALPIEGKISSGYVQNNVLTLALIEQKKNHVRFIESTDYGDTWTLKSSDTSLPAIRSAIIWDMEHIVALGYNSPSRVYLSTNRGQSWDTVMSESLNAQLSDILVTPENTLFVIGNKKSIISVNLNTRSTEVLSHIPGNRANFGSHLQYRDNALYYVEGGAENAFLRMTRSTDAGATWLPTGQTINEGLFIADIYFLNGAKGFMLAWGNAGALYETNDSGKTWFRRTLPVSTRWLGEPLFSFADAATGVVEAENSESVMGVITTTNGGETWQQAFDAKYIVRHPHLIRTNTGALLAAASYDKTFTTANLILSSDYGKTWLERHIADSLAIECLYAFDSATLLVLGSSVKKDSLQQGRIYRSTDGGVTWSQTGQQHIVAPKTIAVEKDLCIVGCSNADSILISTDKGRTWTSTYFRPSKPWQEHTYSLFRSCIHGENYYASGISTLKIDPNPDTQRSSFLLRCSVTSLLTSVQDAPIPDAQFSVSPIQVVPHPVRQTSTLSFVVQPSCHTPHIGLYSLQGVLVQDISSLAEIHPLTGEGKILLHTNGLSAGVYVLKVHSPHQTTTQTLIILP